MSFLKVEDVFSGYGAGDILQGVSLRMDRNEMTCIIGPNGAGKSTLLKTIVGLLRPRKGAIRFKEKVISDLRPAEIIKYGICYVPQEENIFPNLTLVENLEMGAYVVKENIGKRMEEVQTLFPILKERRALAARALSGGERQMLALGMALMVQPQLLVLDEPSAGLSPTIVEEIFQKIQEINRRGVAVLMVEQNAWESLQIAHRAYLMVMGKNRMEGTGKEFLENPQIRESFLGR